ncbi:hypothetical protein L0337_33155 [candidate division KSB1 bacterium]|nr:hypothetical protein [candidate division KSB1 bacterium]
MQLDENPIAISLLKNAGGSYPLHTDRLALRHQIEIYEFGKPGDFAGIMNLDGLITCRNLGILVSYKLFTDRLLEWLPSDSISAFCLQPVVRNKKTITIEPKSNLLILHPNEDYSCFESE